MRRALGIQLGALALFNLDLFRLVEGGGAGAKLRLSERAQHDARLGLRGNDRRRRFGRRRSFAGGEASEDRTTVLGRGDFRFGLAWSGDAPFDLLDNDRLAATVAETLAHDALLDAAAL